MQVKGGVTRIVFLTMRWAIKVPTVRYGWAKFLQGLLANMQERTFSCMAEEFRLCPVRFAVPGGWLSVMPRCQPLSESAADIIHQGQMAGACEWHGMDCDFKPDNFGMLDGQIVLFDYGDMR